MRDFTADLLCHNVEIEPYKSSLENILLSVRTANTEDGAWFWGQLYAACIFGRKRVRVAL